MNRRETILVADEDINTCHFLKKRLSYLGYKVIIATNGQEVLSLFTRERPNLIILEIILSKLNGYKICKILQNFISI